MTESKALIDDYSVYPESFYIQPTLELAQNLLGSILLRQTDEGIIAGYIVETEAYIGPMDQAAHSYQNRRTKRTEVMFAEPGRIYTYVMHTHCLVNVVSGENGAPEAVLIRALEPLTGIQLMKKRRGLTELQNLTNGPGKLTKALGITMKDYGSAFFEPPLMIAKGYKPESISSGKRIGIDNSGEAKDYPWRFWITENPFISRKERKSKTN
ncbi:MULTISPECIES: DNA-3-methyladenine glycosylase [unclassified Bacillus (in: firmicutes)]|uniref:DNA-3-methyladenine glycosylase n=1 Tax=unclassified Bacillus (in: firmicutes) TaxID=185979 RepID=UPI0008EA2EFE|nr:MULTISPECIES: DNA-3-methyladenine glycosylase [unclassified Bacillus (in: firmicutes)]SFA81116.1 DNA-3-methyladenine glycosylase [Bacillus sp. UNCCL13]SFQ71240.1 DNA-3-methyladenine glycosylase [Bacillus sp. cl95]